MVDIHTCMFDIRKRKLYSGFIPYLAHSCGQNFLSFKIFFFPQDLPPARPVFCVCGRGFAFASAVSASDIDMTQLLLLGKFEYTGGPIFKVVLEC